MHRWFPAMPETPGEVSWRSEFCIKVGHTYQPYELHLLNAPALAAPNLND